jgi:hypothetical protein
LDSLYKGLRATKQQLEQDQPTELIFITKSVFEAVYGLGMIMEYFLIRRKSPNTIAMDLMSSSGVFKGRKHRENFKYVYRLLFIDAHLSTSCSLCG